jgi:hypothetical protein
MQPGRLELKKTPKESTTNVDFQARWEQKKWQNSIEVLSQMEREKSPVG